MRIEPVHNLSGGVMYLLGRCDLGDIAKLNLALEHIGKQQGVILLSNILPDTGRICSHRDINEFSIEIGLAYQVVEKWARKKFSSREKLEDYEKRLVEHSDEGCLKHKTFSELQSIRQCALNIMRATKRGKYGSRQASIFDKLYHPVYLDKYWGKEVGLYHAASELNIAAKAEIVSRVKAKYRMWRVK